jgi:probable HAF family extracellular repeat protein
MASLPASLIRRSGDDRQRPSAIRLDMRLPDSSSRADTVRRALLSLGAPHGIALLAFALLAGCGIDSPTGPSENPLVPGAAVRALTGATSTEILPDVEPAFPIRGDARGLNSSGQVTGTELGVSPTSDDFKPYRWTPGSSAVRLIGCCDTEWGEDINDAGVVVGTAQTSLIVGNRGFVAVGTDMVALPILAGSDPEDLSGAVAINNAGQIVGFSPSPTGRHAVLWSSTGVVEDLGTLGGTTSQAIDINASGQVIGKSRIAGDAETHFFLWSTETGMQDLNTLLGAITSVVEINDAGQIIGTYTATGGASHAFIFTPGSGLRDLGTLGGMTSAPTGLNNNGQVVGSSTLADASTHAFLWTPTDGMEDITAITGFSAVHRLNDNLQTLAGPVGAQGSPSDFSTTGKPLLVQLDFTPSGADAAPVAAFTWVCVRKQCVFDARTSSDDHGIVSYDWDFDRDHGGGRTHGATTKTTYPKGGTHEVTLTVTDTKGQTNSVTRTVNAP